MAQRCNDLLKVSHALMADRILDEDTREIVRRFYGIDRDQQEIAEIAITYGWKQSEVEFVLHRFHRRNDLTPSPELQAR